MSQRASGYSRKPLDLYETPEWVTEALLPHLPDGLTIWEPACGSGKMVRPLESAGHKVRGTDIAHGRDFLTGPIPIGCNAIVTNPPYTTAREFIARALDIMSPAGGIVAVLLRTDYDHAITRRDLFSDCSAFAKKLALTRRIVWFDGPKAQPSFNHAWFIWDWKHKGPPTLAYGPA